MFIRDNLNPAGKNVGDCVVRALAKALRISWEDAYTAVSGMGYVMHDMPSSNRVWGACLRKKGFIWKPVTKDETYTVREFCIDHPIGVYVVGLDGHVVCVEDGDYYDTWDSGREIPLYYWTLEG